MSRLLLAAVACKAVACDGRAVVVLVALLTACSVVPRPSGLATGDDPGIPVWVVGHGWHVGVAMRRADVRRDLWPAAHDLGALEHVEVGWGDGGFYPAEHGTVALAARAAFRSASSVLHVAAFDGDVTDYFVGVPVVELRLRRAGFDGLCRFIAAAYARTDAGDPLPLRTGLYGVSRFYLAREHYHVFDNSNNWAVRALRAGGVPLEPALMFYAGTVLDQVARHGRVLRSW